MAKKKHSNQGSFDAMFSNVGQVVEIAIKDIKPNPKQPRFDVKNANIDELAASIETHGLLQPPVVCETDGGGYMLIGGERRIEALKKLGRDKATCFVFSSAPTDASLGVLALVENIDRKKLHPIEIGFMMDNLMKGGLFASQKELSSAFKYSDATISKYLSTLKLPKEILESVKNEDYRDLEVICALNTIDEANALLAWQEIVANSMDRASAIAYIRSLKKGKKPKALPFVLKNSKGILSFKANTKKLSAEKQELLRAKLSEIEKLFS